MVTRQINPELELIIALTMQNNNKIKTSINNFRRHKMSKFQRCFNNIITVWLKNIIMN